MSRELTFIATAPVLATGAVASMATVVSSLVRAFGMRLNPLMPVAYGEPSPVSADALRDVLLIAVGVALVVSLISVIVSLACESRAHVAKDIVPYDMPDDTTGGDDDGLD